MQADESDARAATLSGNNTLLAAAVAAAAAAANGSLMPGNDTSAASSSSSSGGGDGSNVNDDAYFTFITEGVILSLVSVLGLVGNFLAFIVMMRCSVREAFSNQVSRK